MSFTSFEANTSNQKPAVNPVIQYLHYLDLNCLHIEHQ